MTNLIDAIAGWLPLGWCNIFQVAVQAVELVGTPGAKRGKQPATEPAPGTTVEQYNPENNPADPPARLAERHLDYHTKGE